MHFSTVASVFIISLLAAAPTVAEPVDFKRALSTRHVVCNFDGLWTTV